MYKLSLIFFCFIGILGCASNPEVVDRRKELEEKENSRLDQWNISQMVFNNDTKALEDLINSGKVNLKTDRTFFQNTITHVMSNCNLKSLQLVLEKGAPLDELNIFEDTPLSIAVGNKQIACAQELLVKGSRTMGRFSFENPLISIAAKTNFLPMIKLLMKYNVCPLDNGFINTPVLEIYGLDQEIKDLLTTYIDFYIKKFGPKCPEKKPLPKK